MRHGLLWLLLWLPLMGRSQTPLHVVTKVIERDIPYTNGQRLRINGQKADLLLKGWNRPVVSVRLRLIARHPDRAVAEQEVGYQTYTIQSETGQIDLANQFTAPRSGKLQSQLKAVYEVSLPSRALITLTNSLGDIHLSNLSGDVTLRFEFGKLTLDEVGGKLSITASYGDVDGRHVAANLRLKAEKTDVVLSDVSGSVNLQSRYGKVTLLPAPSLTSLTIEAARTEILITTQRLSDFRFDVIAAFGDIRLPESMTSQLDKYAGKQVFTYQPPGRKPDIRIQNTYSSITIQGEKTVVDR